MLGYAPDRVERPGEAVAALVAAEPGHPVRARRRRRRSPRRSTGSPRASRTGRSRPTPTRAGSRRTCCCRRPSACRSRRRSCRSRWPAATCARDEPICVVGFRALKDFHPALLADNLRRAGHEARSVELDLLPETRRDANALGLARAFDDAGVPRRGAAPGDGAPRAPASASRSRRCWGSPTRTRSGRRSSAGSAARCSRCRRCRRPSRACACSRSCATPLHARRRADRAQQRRDGRRARRRARDGAARAGRPARGAPRRGLGRAGDGRVRRGRAGARLALGGARGRARAAGRGRPRPGEERFRPGYFERHPMGARRDRRRRRAAAGRRRTASGCSRTCSSRARRSPGAEPWREKSGDGLSLATGHRAAELVLGARTAGTDAPSAATARS